MEKPQTLKEYLLGFKIYLPLAGSLLLIFLLFTTIVKGRIQVIGQTKREVARERDRLAVLVNKQTKLAALNKEDLKKNFVLAEQSLPSKRDTAGFLAQIERIGMETGVLIEGVQIEGGEIATKSGKKQITPKKSPKNWFKAKVTLKGAVENIKDFLERIFNSRRIVNVVRVELSAPLTQVATPSAMTANLTVEVYFKPLPKSMGPVEEPLPTITEKEKEVFQKIASFPFLSEPLSLPFAPQISATPSARINPFGP